MYVNAAAMSKDVRHRWTFLGMRVSGMVRMEAELHGEADASSEYQGYEREMRTRRLLVAMLVCWLLTQNNALLCIHSVHLPESSLQMDKEKRTCVSIRDDDASSHSYTTTGITNQKYSS